MWNPSSLCLISRCWGAKVIWQITLSSIVWTHGAYMGYGTKTITIDCLYVRENTVVLQFIFTYFKD